MKNTRMLIVYALAFGIAGILMAGGASAHSHSYFEVSDTLSYNSHFSKNNQGFYVKKTTDLPRNTCGYYDWSAEPKYCGPAIINEIPEPVMKEAFKTYQMELAMKQQIKVIDKLKHKHYGVYGGKVVGYGYSPYYKPGVKAYYW